MKRDLPTIVVVAAFSLLFFSRNWLTWLLADSFWSMAMPVLICLLLLVLSVSAVVLWQLPRTNPARKQLPSVLVMLLCVMLALLSDAIYLRGLPAGSFATSFKSQVWQDESAQRRVPRDLTPRQKMLGHVVTQILPVSKRSAIERDLGIPPAAGYFEEIKPDLLYYLGPERDGAFAIDSEWLAIWFWGDGSVATWKILTD